MRLLSIITQSVVNMVLPKLFVIFDVISFPDHLVSN